jgi:hypothetical protein
MLFVLLVLAGCAAAEQPAEQAAEAGAATAPVANSQDDLIRNAERAGPASIAAAATIMDWEMNVIREGDNGWTCLPDRPDTPNDDPYCVDQQWLDFLGAYVNQTDPSPTGLGFAYMLVEDSPVSNTDPYATEPTGPEDWVTGVKGHLMLLVPDNALLEGVSTDHMNGGPWVMWPGTPYAHIMIPVDSRWPEDAAR